MIQKKDGSSPDKVMVITEMIWRDLIPDAFKKYCIPGPAPRASGQIALW